jgi:hypothetical protein
MSEAIDINPPEVVESAPEVEAPEAPSAQEAPEAPEVKVHPAYEKVLAELPEAWHEKIVPHLQEQDKYFQQQLEKYTPFKEFMDVDISPDVIRDSLRLAEVALTDPVYLYRTLAEQLREQGLLEEAEVAEKAADEAEETSEDEDYELSPALRKEFEARDAKLKEQEEYIESVKFEAEVQAEQAELESQIEDLTSRYDITDVQMDKILKVLEVQLASDENATVFTAARELAEIAGIRYPAKGVNPKEDAPTVIGGGGGGGIPSNPLEIPRDGKAKKAMLAQMFEQQLKGGNY